MSHLPIWMLGTLPVEIVDAAVREFSELALKDAAMGLEADVSDTSQRNTSICFAPEGHWFGGILNEHGRIANAQMGWHYDIDDHEAVQWAAYGPEQHYDWHVDVFPLSGRPRERKVTVVCLMNEPSEFEGGEFQVRLYQQYAAPLTKGTMIAFPSILEHRVTPVLSGVRNSATVWLNGPRFR